MILRKCILCVFLAALSIHSLKADDDPCHIYGGAMSVAVFRSTLVYDISKYKRGAYGCVCPKP